MKPQHRPVAAGAVLLILAVGLLLFLNYAKFGATLEGRERVRHALLGAHLAKTLDARLALGLELEDTPVLQAMLRRELAYDPRLRAIAAIDTHGAVRMLAGSGHPPLWQQARAALQDEQPMPAHGDTAALAEALHNGFGETAGWLVLEYDLSGSHQQARAAFRAVWPLAAGALVLALLVLLGVAPRLLSPGAQSARHPLRRLTVLIAVLLLLVHGVIALSAYRAFTRVSSEDAPRLANTLAHTLTPGLERALDQGIAPAQLRGVDEWLQPALAAGAEFAGLSIDDAGGQTLFAVGDTHGASAGHSVYRFPLQQDAREVAVLNVTIDLAPLAERTRQLAIEFGTLLAISVLIAMEVLHGVLARTLAGGKGNAGTRAAATDDVNHAGSRTGAGIDAAERAGAAALSWLRLPLFLFFAGGELPRAFLPMWARQLAQQPLPQAWSGTLLADVFAPFAQLPPAVRTTLPISLFLLTIALVSPLAGRYSARHGPVRLLQFGLLLALLGNVQALLSESLLSLCLARVLAGASSGFVTVAAFDYIGRSGARARGMALYLSAYVAAGICGAGLGGLLVERAGTAAVFEIGMACTLLAGVTLTGLPAPVAAAGGAAPARLFQALGQLLREPRFMRLLVLVGLPMQVLQQGLLFYWAPLALSAQGEPTSFVGLAMMGYFLLVLLFNAPAARWADRSGHHTAIVLAGLALAGCAGLLGGVLYTSSAIALSVALIGMIWAAAFPAQGAMVLRLADDKPGARPATVTIGVYRMMERFGAMLAPPLIALMIGLLGYAGTARFIGATLVGCALLQAWLSRRETLT